MAKLVVLGLFLTASQAASRSATAVVSEGRVGIGLITGGDFGPGSFSIGADGKNADQMIPHIGPDANAKGAIIDGVATGKGGKGGTGGGQIIIGTVSMPSNQHKNNRRSNNNKPVRDNSDSSEEDSWENDVFLSSEENQHSRPKGSTKNKNKHHNNRKHSNDKNKGTNQNNSGNSGVPNAPGLCQNPPLNNGPSKSVGSTNGQHDSNNSPGTVPANGQYNSNDGPNIAVNGHYPLNNGPVVGSEPINGQYALNYGQSSEASNLQHGTNTMYTNPKSSQDGDEGAWVWA